MDRSLSEALSNLKLLCSGGRTPPPDAFHRVLMHAHEAAHADSVMKAFNISRSSAVAFTAETSTLAAAACVRMARIDLALGWFNDPSRSRLFPTRNAYMLLFKYAVAAKGGVPLAPITASFFKSAVVKDVDTCGMLMRAQLESGDVAAAVKVFKHLKSSGGVSARDPRPVFNVMKYLLSHPEGVEAIKSDSECGVAALEELQADAALCSKAGLVDVRSKFATMLAAAPATPAAAPAAEAGKVEEPAKQGKNDASTA